MRPSYYLPAVLALVLVAAVVVLRAPPASPAAFEKALLNGRPERAVRILEDLADEPAELEKVDRNALNFLLEALGEDRRLSLRFFAALDEGGYRPADPFRHADWLWREYALLLLQEGRRPEAGEAAARIGDPDEIILMLLDRRFADLVRERPRTFDIRAQAEQALAEHRALAARHPDRLIGRVLIASDLHELGRPLEALAVLDQAVEAAAADAGRFSDAETEMQWALDERSAVLWGLGRYDEAIAASRRAGKVTVADDRKGAVAANLANMQVSLGRFEDALQTVDEIGPDGAADKYVETWIRSHRVCALGETSQRREAAGEIARLAAEREENPASYTRALLCNGDLDGAAASYLERLRHPRWRSEVSAAFSEYDPPAALPPHDQVMLQRKRQVRARPDVAAALERQGPPARIPLVFTAGMAF